MTASTFSPSFTAVYVIHDQGWLRISCTRRQWRTAFTMLVQTNEISSRMMMRYFKSTRYHPGCHLDGPAIGLRFILALPQRGSHSNLLTITRFGMYRRFLSKPLRCSFTYAHTAAANAILRRKTAYSGVPPQDKCSGTGCASGAPNTMSQE